MNRTGLVRLVLAVALAWPARVTWAQQALEIIPLRHRTVEQVLPVLQPLLEPGATLSGSRGQLFLRASAANAAEIKRALGAIDRPARRLEISVRAERADEREQRVLGAAATAGSGGARVAIVAQESRGTAAERVDQRVQVLEGSHARVGSGLEVVPRLAGRNVTLEVLAQPVSTVVSARLGEWVEIGSGASGRIWVKVDEVPN
jgi:hypothetical protein